MASYTKFQKFAGHLGIAALNLNTDTLSVYLSNTAPTVSTNDTKTDLAEISTGNGYSGAVDTGNTYSASGGTGTCASSASVTITASGGSVGPFRYVVLQDQTVSNYLIAYWDYGSSITLNDGESFTVTFGSSTLFTIA